MCSDLQECRDRQMLYRGFNKKKKTLSPFEELKSSCIRLQFVLK